jgi:hypothetical protein
LGKPKIADFLIYLCQNADVSIGAQNFVPMSS